MNVVARMRLMTSTVPEKEEHCAKNMRMQENAEGRRKEHQGTFQEPQAAAKVKQKEA